MSRTLFSGVDIFRLKLAPCTKKSRDLLRHVEGQTNRLLRETMAASWDQERIFTQIFALITSLFRNKTTLIHSSNLNYTQGTSVIEHLHSLSLANALGESLFQLVHELIDSVIHPSE